MPRSRMEMGSPFLWVVEFNKNKVKTVPNQLFGNRTNSIMWKYSKYGDFSTNLAYQLANEDSATKNQFQGQWLWKLDVLPKILSFLWLCVHGSIPVKSVLAARGINSGKTCPLCTRHEETIIHPLQDCEVAHDLWYKLGVPASHINSFNENFETWLKINCLSTVRHNTSIPWSTLFVFAFWCLWKNRNKVVFENTILNSRLDKDCIVQAREYFSVWVKPPSLFQICYPCQMD